MSSSAGMMTAAQAEEERSLVQALRRLRFEPNVEAAFRHDYETASVASRTLLFTLSTLAVLLTPVYDLLFLHPPGAFVPVSRFIQFGIEIPALLIGLLTLLPRLRFLMAPAVVFSAVVVAAGLFAQRMIGAGYDYSVPFDFAAIAIASVYTLGRLRFNFFFPWALLIFIGASIGEIHTFGPSSGALYNCVSLFIMFSMLSGGGYLLERTARENWYRRRQLSQLALHDPLTGLPNRRHFDETLHQRVRAAARDRGNVALMMLDIDEFKAYNDHYGHQAGDVCLNRIGIWLATQMRRPNDFCARIGGEEFVAVWCNARPEDARRLAEALRVGIAQLGIAHEARVAGGVVTASGGFVEMLAPEPEEAARGIAKMMVLRADELLYKAKKAGRNQLVLE